MGIREYSNVTLIAGTCFASNAELSEFCNSKQIDNNDVALVEYFDRFGLDYVNNGDHNLKFPSVVGKIIATRDDITINIPSEEYIDRIKNSICSATGFDIMFEDIMLYKLHGDCPCCG